MDFLGDAIRGFYLLRLQSAVIKTHTNVNSLTRQATLLRCHDMMYAEVKAAGLLTFTSVSAQVALEHCSVGTEFEREPEISL